MLIHQVAKLTGLSIRTLHYYHELKLVIPNQDTGTGYRHYNEVHLKQLEHIQFFKELGFSLKQIQSMLQNKSFNSLEAFKLQHRVLLAKQAHLEKQIKVIEQIIQNENKGGYIMEAPLQFNLKQYEQEAREKWGNNAVDESLFRISHLSEEQQAKLNQEWSYIYRSLAKQMDNPVDHHDTTQLIAQYYKLLNTYFGTYDYNAFIGLGQLYTMDERFTANIDKYRSGLAQYMHDAMLYWSTVQKKISDN